MEVGGPVAVSCFDPGPMTTAWHLYRRVVSWSNRSGTNMLKTMKKYGNPLVKPHHSEHKYGNITDLTWDRLDLGSTVNVDDMPGDVVKFDLLGN